MGASQCQSPSSPLASQNQHKLSPAEYNICYLNGDEVAFNNEYFDNFSEGLYVSRVSLKTTGELTVLFSSRDKLELGMGYCCFQRPALQVRRKVRAPTKVQYVQKINYYQTEYSNQFIKQPGVG